MSKNFSVGEIVPFGNVKMKVVEAQKGTESQCENCSLKEVCEALDIYSISYTGSCFSEMREDGKDIYFEKLSEEK